METSPIMVDWDDGSTWDGDWDIDCVIRFYHPPQNPYGMSGLECQVATSFEAVIRRVWCFHGVRILRDVFCSPSKKKLKYPPVN